MRGYMKGFLYITCAIVLPSVQSIQTRVYEGEYCDTEVFRAECREGEVIVMTEALYGRIRIGRCVEMDLGYMGCHRDVLSITDIRCSGLRICEIKIPDKEFESLRPCIKELKTYLNATYSCVPVNKPPPTSTLDCVPTYGSLEGARLGSISYNTIEDEGYLSSTLSFIGPSCEDTFPTPDTPSWVISAAPGRQISLALLDFQGEMPPDLQSDLSGRDRRNVGHLREKVGHVEGKLGHVDEKLGRIGQRVRHSREKLGHNVEKLGHELGREEKLRLSRARLSNVWNKLGHVEEVGQNGGKVGQDWNKLGHVEEVGQDGGKVGQDWDKLGHVRVRKSERLDVHTVLHNEVNDGPGHPGLEHDNKNCIPYFYVLESVIAPSNFDQPPGKKYEKYSRPSRSVDSIRKVKRNYNALEYEYDDDKDDDDEAIVIEYWNFEKNDWVTKMQAKNGGPIDEFDGKADQDGGKVLTRWPPKNVKGPQRKNGTKSNDNHGFSEKSGQKPDFEGNEVKRKLTKVCPPQSRISEVYSSQNNKIEVRLHPRHLQSNFLIHYRVHGCADIEKVSDWSWYQRENERRAVIGCKHNSNTWTLTCVNDQWIGEIGNCAEPTTLPPPLIDFGSSTPPYGVDPTQADLSHETPSKLLRYQIEPAQNDLENRFNPDQNLEEERERVRESNSRHVWSGNSKTVILSSVAGIVALVLITIIIVVIIVNRYRGTHHRHGAGRSEDTTNIKLFHSVTASPSPYHLNVINHSLYPPSHLQHYQDPDLESNRPIRKDRSCDVIISEHDVMEEKPTWYDTKDYSGKSSLESISAMSSSTHSGQHARQQSMEQRQQQLLQQKEHLERLQREIKEELMWLDPACGGAAQPEASTGKRRGPHAAPKRQSSEPQMKLFSTKPTQSQILERYVTPQHYSSSRALYQSPKNPPKMRGGLNKHLARSQDLLDTQPAHTLAPRASPTSRRSLPFNGVPISSVLHSQVPTASAVFPPSPSHSMSYSKLPQHPSYPHPSTLPPQQVPPSSVPTSRRFLVNHDSPSSAHPGRRLLPLNGLPVSNLYNNITNNLRTLPNPRAAFNMMK